MIHWLNFFILLFWLSLALFSLNLSNVLVVMLFSEVAWLGLYVYSILCGTTNDEVTLLTFSFFILGLASAEFSIIFMLVILMKHYNKSLDLHKFDLKVKNLFLKKTATITNNKI